MRALRPQLPLGLALVQCDAENLDLMISPVVRECAWQRCSVRLIACVSPLDQATVASERVADIARSARRRLRDIASGFKGLVPCLRLEVLPVGLLDVLYGGLFGMMLKFTRWT